MADGRKIRDILSSLQVNPRDSDELVMKEKEMKSILSCVDAMESQIEGDRIQIGDMMLLLAHHGIVEYEPDEQSF